MRFSRFMTLAALLSGLFSVNLQAAHSEANPAQHKLVIQVSSDDPKTQGIALNNAVNMQKELGMDNIAIEIVAYGPGLSILTANGKQAQRVSSLAKQNITFSACGNTMKKVEKKSGKPVVLADGVGVVKAGVMRIMELQEQGYSYVRP